LLGSAMIEEMRRFFNNLWNGPCLRLRHRSQTIWFPYWPIPLLQRRGLRRLLSTEAPPPGCAPRRRRGPPKGGAGTGTVVPFESFCAPCDEADLM
jgi:hypothetical protein